MRCAIPNCKGLGIKGESDLIAVTKSSFVHEFEIKCSVSDLKRDVKDKVKKHKVLEAYHRSLSSYRKNEPPNYFWIVCPEDVYEKGKDFIPEYAGIMKAKDSDFMGYILKTVKDAPRLHSDSMSTRLQNYIMRGLSYRFWDLNDC